MKPTIKRPTASPTTTAGSGSVVNLQGFGFLQWWGHPFFTDAKLITVL
jgi:hypothetical protein